jgi:hypothetical protein
MAKKCVLISKNVFQRLLLHCFELKTMSQRHCPPKNKQLRHFGLQRAAETKLAVEATLANATPTPSTSREGSPIVTSVSKASAPPALPHSQKSKRAYVSDEDNSESDDDGEREDARTNPKPKGSFLYCYLGNGMILTDLEFQQKKHVHLL